MLLIVIFGWLAGFWFIFGNGVVILVYGGFYGELGVCVLEVILKFVEN